MKQYAAQKERQWHMRQERTRYHQQIVSKSLKKNGVSEKVGIVSETNKYGRTHQIGPVKAEYEIIQDWH
jgi:hypothetical protein